MMRADEITINIGNSTTRCEVDPVITIGVWIALLVLMSWIIAIVTLDRKVTGAVSAKSFIFPLFLGLFILLWVLSDLPQALQDISQLHQTFISIVGIFLTLVWLISVAKRDSSIMDIAYPLTAAVPTLVIVASRDTWSSHEQLIVGLVWLWAIRLAAHIGVRNLPEGEDPRYASWRKKYGKHWWWWSFFQVFTLQGILITLWSTPLLFALNGNNASLTSIHLLASVLFVIGFFFQALSDYQLEKFRKNRKSKTEILNTGLWSLSRHPNYFGEAVIWWSFGVLGLTHPWGILGLLAPLYVTWFMSKGSATPMQERYLSKKKPGYDQYVASVPAFFPRFKRR